MTLELEQIQEIEKREFGFMFMNLEKPMRRYQRFSSQEELEYYIEEEQPDHCFVSTAYYKDGDLNMNGWIGADLFFDFDVDAVGNKRLAQADAESSYLMLLDNFGLKKVRLSFSGSKGYHVMAFDDAPKILNAAARREICDYLKGNGNLKSLDVPASADLRRLRRIVGTKNAKSGRLCSLIKQSWQV